MKSNLAILAPVAAPDCVFSVVSHGQLSLIKHLFSDLRELSIPGVRIYLTLNIPENEEVLAAFSDLPITIIRNHVPKGFGENHNQAFYASHCAYFFVVNPDIRLLNFNLPALMMSFSAPDVGAVAPVVLGSTGEVEDHVRRFPTISRLFKRVFLRKRDVDYHWNELPIDVDWSAGMFVAFRHEAFSRVGGFDTRYFMYMEDADICRRLRLAGWRTVLEPTTAVVHDAQRASRRNIQHLKWHLASAIRFIFFPIAKSHRCGESRSTHLDLK